MLHCLVRPGSDAHNKRSSTSWMSSLPTLVSSSPPGSICWSFTWLFSHTWRKMATKQVYWKASQHTRTWLLCWYSLYFSWPVLHAVWYVSLKSIPGQIVRHPTALYRACAMKLKQRKMTRISHRCTSSALSAWQRRMQKSSIVNNSAGVSGIFTFTRGCSIGATEIRTYGPTCSSTPWASCNACCTCMYWVGSSCTGHPKATTSCWKYCCCTRCRSSRSSSHFCWSRCRYLWCSSGVSPPSMRLATT